MVMIAILSGKGPRNHRACQPFCLGCAKSTVALPSRPSMAIRFEPIPAPWFRGQVMAQAVDEYLNADHGQPLAPFGSVDIWNGSR
jgi:hypothetical protein